MSEETNQKFDTILNEIKEIKKDMATKEELKEVKEGMATKEELNQKTNKILVEVIGIKEELKDCVKKEEFQQKSDEILTAVDKITKDNETIKEEQTANISAHDRYENRLTNLESAKATI